MEERKLYEGRHDKRTERPQRETCQQAEKNAFGMNRETADVLCTITDALRGFPEARTAVVEALRVRSERKAA